MVYRQNRIPVRYPEEVVRRLAFGMVLYGGRSLPNPVRRGLPEFNNAPLKKTSEDWPSEWFYMEDVPLPDPVRGVFLSSAMLL